MLWSTTATSRSSGPSQQFGPGTDFEQPVGLELQAVDAGDSCLLLFQIDHGLTRITHIVTPCRFFPERKPRIPSMPPLRLWSIAFSLLTFGFFQVAFIHAADSKQSSDVPKGEVAKYSFDQS